MLKTKVIGLGAAGNNAVIELLKQGILEKKDVLLINSTNKDVPAEYEDISAIYNRAFGGAAKERSAGKELSLDALRNDKEFSSRIDSFVEPDTELVEIIVATPGGTGSGGAPVVARYYASVIKKSAPKLKISIFCINGFENDIRELQNTLEFYQEIDPSYTVQTISNKKFLDCGLTISNSEDAANKAIVDKISIQIGRNINYAESKHNMDESDLYKLSTTPGFMVTFKVPFSKLKNADHFNKLVMDVIENDKSLDIPRQSISRLGVITNISDKNEEFIDYQFPSVRTKLGNYYELFIHDNKYDGGEEYVEFIAAGLEMPIDEIKYIYDKYKQETQTVVKDKDTFFDFMKDISADANDKMFDTGTNLKVSQEDIGSDFSKDDFFGQFMEKPKNETIQGRHIIRPDDTIDVSSELSTKEINLKDRAKNF